MRKPDLRRLALPAPGRIPAGIDARHPETQPSGTRRADNPLWSAFRDLRTARSVFGLKHHGLHLLECLIGLCANPAFPVVFASNRVLEERSGMPARSLRRHVTLLCERGLAQRRMSPNGKRYVRRVEGVAVDHYGIDLSPLLERAGELMELAAGIRRDEEIIAALRDRIRVALRDLPEDPDSEAIRRLLRRQLDRTTLEDLLARIPQTVAPDAPSGTPEHQAPVPLPHTGHGCPHRTALSGSCPSGTSEAVAPVTTLPEADQAPAVAHSASPADTGKLAGSGGQNGRHLQSTENEIRIPDAPEILRAFPDIAGYCMEEPGSWPELWSMMMKIASYLGITPDLLGAAERRWNRHGVVIAIASILERADRIHRHAAYFRSVTLGRGAERFNPLAIFRNRLNRPDRHTGTCLGQPA
jgi:replication initiation protein RepC